jgi:hypothetical protein
MIKNWEKFNESNNSVSYETLSEVIMFRNNSYMSDNVDLNRRIDHFIDVELGDDIDDLCPVYIEERRQFISRLEGLLDRIKKDSNLSNTLISLYKDVEKKMEGFPKFYELEDLFLDFIDNGWVINFTVKPKVSFEIQISNEMSELSISYDDYVNLQIKSNNIVKRLESHFNVQCEITDSDYGKQGIKNVGSVTFQLTTR